MPSRDVFARDAVWLDLTRLLTRVGAVAPTGIDRVELAWAEHLLAINAGVRGLVRTTRGFLLLPPEGVSALCAAMRGDVLPQADRWSRITARGQRPRHRAEALLRGFAIDRCPPWGLRAMAIRQGLRTYLNVGHSNHTPRVLGPLRQAGACIVVLIHDLIPVTHPELVPPKQPARMAERLACVRDSADLVVAVSEDTETRLRDYWKSSPTMPPIIRSELGMPGLPGDVPQTKVSEGRFLMLGTLEPRKNHALILEVWSALADTFPPDAMPRLDILGQLGWRGAEIAEEIRAHAEFGKTLFLDTAATDATRQAAYDRADTLFYPSLAEGFGLPPHEALAHGLLPICADLPVLRAGLGADAVYADPTDVYLWVETIKKRISGTLPGSNARSAKRPDWSDHISRVVAALAELRD